MELIKLSNIVGIKVMEILKSKGYEPRTNKLGLLSLEFTREELDQITELHINNPQPNCLSGLEYCHNLIKLTINSSYDPYKDQNPSITDKDIKTISKITSLTELNINNQSKITWINLNNLTNLRTLRITKNNHLEEISGLDKLKKIVELNIYGNKELYEIDYLKELIASNSLDSLELDVLNFPEVVDLKTNLSKILNCRFIEVVHPKGELSYNYDVIKLFHNKCLTIIDNISSIAKNKKQIIILLEKYLAENIFYDYEAIANKNRAHIENGTKRGLNNGTQSAYNAIMYNSCVCEGYTRAMQYLLKILKIKTKNVYCIGGKDRIKINKNYHNQIELPDDGYHSIIRVELNNQIYYCDPCWDSCSYHRGDTSLPYCLKSKKDISNDHTLSFEESLIVDDNPATSISSEEIEYIVKNSTEITHKR